MQREKRTLQIYGAEKYTSARHACCMRKGFLYIIECHGIKQRVEVMVSNHILQMGNIQGEK